MKVLTTAHTPEMTKHIRDMKAKNVEQCKLSKAEEWMRRKLKGMGFNRQAIWGYRIFDFWSGKLGIAVEVDGPEHQPKVDAFRDLYNFFRSGIIVVRVRNFNEDDADRAIDEIRNATEWKERRKILGCDGHAGKMKMLRWKHAKSVRGLFSAG